MGMLGGWRREDSLDWVKNPAVLLLQEDMDPVVDGRQPAQRSDRLDLPVQFLQLFAPITDCRDPVVGNDRFSDVHILECFYPFFQDDFDIEICSGKDWSIPTHFLPEFILGQERDYGIG